MLPCRQLPLGVSRGDRGTHALTGVILHGQAAQPAHRDLPAVAWTLLLGRPAAATATAAAAGVRCYRRYGDGQETHSSCGCGHRSCCGSLGRSRRREKAAARRGRCDATALGLGRSLTAAAPAPPPPGRAVASAAAPPPPATTAAAAAAATPIRVPAPVASLATRAAAAAAAARAGHFAPGGGRAADTSRFSTQIQFEYISTNKNVHCGPLCSDRTLGGPHKTRLLACLQLEKYSHSLTALARRRQVVQP